MTVAGQVENDRVIRLVDAYREKGDRRAVERIFAMHGRILHHIVRRYSSSSGEPYEDLLQVGYVGLIKAVNGYKTDSKAKFSSYAYSMIDGELRHHFRDTALVKKPRWARSLYAGISESTTRLTGELGRPPLIEEIARDVNVTPEGVVEVMKLFLDTNVSSLDAPAGGAGSGGDEGPNLSAIKSLQYEAFSLPVEDRILLEQGLESLSELQQKIVYLSFSTRTSPRRRSANGPASRSARSPASSPRPRNLSRRSSPSAGRILFCKIAPLNLVRVYPAREVSRRFWDSSRR